jgi:RNA polymerase sigma factor (sigma-70 family)
VRADGPYCVFHPSFEEPGAAEVYAAEEALTGDGTELPFLPDLQTRDCARRMHYAAYRVRQARRPAEARTWKRKYYALRDRIVLGNRKLVYRAVRKRMAFSNRSDDMIGEGHLVLIRAVEAYNPWLGVRFSTYAFTCLMRALARLTQRFAADWLTTSPMLDTLSEGQLPEADDAPERVPLAKRLDEFFGKDHPLLSDREKFILARRFSLEDGAAPSTLDQVGRDLGLSKERVRQVQAGALDKLREAMTDLS